MGRDRAEESELDFGSRISDPFSTNSSMIGWSSLWNIGSETGAVVRLIQKWLKAGVVEQGQWIRDEGRESARIGDFADSRESLPALCPGSLGKGMAEEASARRDVIIVRYADDGVLGFEQREEAERFLEELRERLGKFGLELHPEKTRLIEFGRYAAERREKRGEGKPETFNFLGFTHICGTSHQTGYFTVHRRTIGKRMTAKLKDIRAKLRRAHAWCPSYGGEMARDKWCGGTSNTTPSRATGLGWKRFAMGCCTVGSKRYGGEASAVA